MSSGKVWLVAGAPGLGKTRWIGDRLAQGGLYWSPQLGGVATDRHLLQALHPRLSILEEMPPSLPQGQELFIEIGFHLDLADTDRLIQSLVSAPIERIAFVPEQLQDSIWHGWADRVYGVPCPYPLEDIQLWRSPLTGEVFDPASLTELFGELSDGAYGDVYRCKGIFDITDGRYFYIDYVMGNEEIIYQELPMALWLSGRPQRFAGIEIFGSGLKGKAIGETLADCCLTEDAIYFYQNQIKQSLSQLAV